MNYDEELDPNVAKAAGAEITVFKTMQVALRDLIEEKKKELSKTPKTDSVTGENLFEHARKMEIQRDRAIGICDAMMAWETPADARKTTKDLSALKKEINQ